MELHPVANVVEYTLGGLEQRADVRAHNLANLNTPGFRAERVDFETPLRAALERGYTRHIPEPLRQPSPSLPNPNGNTVDMEGELVGMMRDNLLRDAMVNAYNARVGALRTVITGR